MKTHLDIDGTEVEPGDVVEIIAHEDSVYCGVTVEVCAMSQDEVETLATVGPQLEAMAGLVAVMKGEEPPRMDMATVIPASEGGWPESVREDAEAKGITLTSHDRQAWNIGETRLVRREAV